MPARYRAQSGAPTASTVETRLDVAEHRVETAVDSRGVALSSAANAVANAVAGVHRVAARSTHEDVLAGAADERVASGVPAQAVASGLALLDVAAGAALDPVVARAAQDGVPEIGRATSELQSRQYLVCRLLLEQKKRTCD